jgi:hypothetical protein
VPDFTGVRVMTCVGSASVYDALKATVADAGHRGDIVAGVLAHRRVWETEVVGADVVVVACVRLRRKYAIGAKAV